MYHTVNRTSAALRGAHRNISEMMAGARLPVTLCHIEHDRVAVGIGDTTALPALQRELEALAPGAPLRVFRCAPAERHANKQDYNRPLRGGVFLSCPDGQSVGTLCVSATRAGQSGFVTCGHVATQDGVQVYQPRNSMQNDWLVGTVAAVSAFATRASSDSAFVASAAPIAERAIWRSSSADYVVDGIYDAPATTRPRAARRCRCRARRRRPRCATA